MMDGRKKPGYLEEIAGEARKYADLRLDEFKLRTTRALSKALGQMLSYFVAIALLVIVLGLLAFALLQWLNSLLGAPWGTLVVAAVFLMGLAIVWSRREKMFSDSFVKVFINAFYPEEDESE